MKRRAAVAVMLVACSAGTEVERRTAVERGRELFASPTASPSKSNAFSCATCHLAEATTGGSLLAGYSLAGATARPTFWGGQRTDLLQAINDCRTYFMSAPRAWTADDPDAVAMYAFLASLPPQQPNAMPFTLVKSAEELPRGDPARGQVAYDAACRSCHGAARTGEGLLRKGITTLPDEAVRSFRESFGFGDKEIRLAFIEKVRHGPFLGLSGTMPPYSQEALSDADLAAILSFLGLYR